MVATATPRSCSIANALEVIGERWSLLALREVFMGVHRFDQIAKNTGASRDILATRLKKLVEVGVLAKTLYSEHPPRSEYHLTATGRELHTVLLSLMHWGDRHVTQGPPPIDWTHTCGHRFEPAFTCSRCGGPAGPETLTLSDHAGEG